MANQNETTEPNAEVIAVYPNRVKISVDDLSKFSTIDSQLEKLRVGSYLEVSDDDNHKLIVIIESYSIEYKEDKVIDENGDERILKNKKYIIEANPLGTLVNDKFQRGGDSLTIPPTKVRPASADDIKKIYQSDVTENEKFSFATLLTNKEIEVPVNGNKFFNKHFAIVGSTGSGKSHTVAKVLQEAVSTKNAGYDGLNNSHIVIFDVHGEYKKAFPNSNYIDIDNLTLPYWLLNSDELTELFIDTDANDHNQRSVFQEAVTSNKKKHSTGDALEKSKIHFDSPLYFDINEVLQYLKYRNTEQKQKDTTIVWVDSTGEEFTFSEKTSSRLFEKGLKIKDKGSATGTLNSKFINFINRLEIKLNDKRLDFLLNETAKSISFENTIKQFIGYSDDTNKNSNVTIIDLGGIPFEALSITVSLISRILFEFGFYYKKKLNENIDCETPILLLYEEAHKYVPKSDLVKYRSSKTAIERIAKEGRKYGVTLGIVSQRPSEVSETIFSQCNTFIAMRLTNPDDQNYVKKLLPDTMGNMTEMLPSLKAGDALLVGESIAIPSLVHLNECSPSPKSSDIKYIEVWKEKWKDVNFDDIIKEWKK
ncbi:ATP-binding protein [Winogradskyella helgolandensis]|uniref:ATP-binding protein n=1 Tax=Winogradskyella helgolandensis TaxID=2697010 RepID=UPI0015C052FE|nr:ATP-binding protein [Winogradskyella helgolandensis]